MCLRHSHESLSKCQRSDQDIVVNVGKGCREVKKIRYFYERIALMRWYWMQRRAVVVLVCRFALLIYMAHLIDES